jgi:hypothetical protein
MGGNWTSSSWGGSGAGYHAIIKTKDVGNFTLVVGSGGIGRGGNKGATSVSGTSGSASTLTSLYDGSVLISAGGGGGSTATINGRTQGTGGVLTKSQEFIEDTVYISTDGQSGTSGGTPGPISGHTWGASGNSSGGSNGSRADPSYHGYGKIEYLCPLDLDYVSAGIYYLYINKPSKYRLTMIGAGGGGSSNTCEEGASTLSACSGAGGGGIVANVSLDAGIYVVSIGLGGYGTWGKDYLGGRCGTGGDTIFKTTDDIIIAQCFGGTGGRAWYKGNYSVGTGGTSTYNSSYVSNVSAYTGSNGTGGTTPRQIYSCPDTIPVTFHGRGGYVTCGGAWGGDGSDGYFRLEFLSLL